MGQHYRIVNLSRAEQFDPTDTGEGEKLMEFSHNGAGAAAALLLLLNGQWGGDRVAVLGDYGLPEDLPGHVIAETGFDGSAYDHPGLGSYGPRVRSLLTACGLASFTEREVFGTSRIVREANRDVLDADGCGIVVWNIDKAQYLDPEGFGDCRDLNHTAASGGNGGTITALMVLLAASSAGGLRVGGEIATDSPLVGSWAGDRIMVTAAHPLPVAAENITPSVRAMLAAAGEGAYDVEDDGFVIRDDPFKSRRTPL